MYQFGFKNGLSTSSCTSAIKKTVEYYLCLGSHVFTCFVNFSKAFDNVNYWKLFRQLIDDGSDMCLVRLLVF